MRLLNSPLLFWAIVVLPAPLMFAGASGIPVQESAILPKLGMAALWLLMLALVAQCLGAAFAEKPWGRWLVRQCPRLCAAALIYAAVHHYSYFHDMMSFIGPKALLNEVWDLRFLSGYIVLGVLAALTLVAILSTISGLAIIWKWIAWLIIPAFVLALAHWFLMDGELALPLAHLAIGLSLWITFLAIGLFRRNRRQRKPMR